MAICMYSDNMQKLSSQECKYIISLVNVISNYARQIVMFKIVHPKDDYSARASCTTSENCTSITRAYLYDFDPLKPHFYIVKLGFTGVYIIFHISAQKHRLWGPSTHNLCFEQKYEKYQDFLSENFNFWVVKFSVYLNRHVFVMKLL